MKKYGVNELRKMFLDFMESKGHLVMPSFSLIPHNDNSLLLINAGMAPLKPYFTGEEIPPRTRVATCQKCIRTGDIENVGKTARHGTFFEMLGNFSFGDYFKTEAIHWTWEFLTDVVGLEKDRLYPSVYLEDDEAFAIWRDEIGIPEERIYRFGKEDNFWEHGAGPCGPCSEVYYDRGEKYGNGDPNEEPGSEGDRFMEIWNDVFTQFENDGQGNYTTLQNKNIDTGMGLERLAVAVQDVDSMFDIDTIFALREKVCEVAGVTYKEDADTDVSVRVITDHIRSATFMISDGILPSNAGRGYVLRRLIRRAARHGRLLKIEGGFLAELSKTVIEISADAYPELAEKADFIREVLDKEEQAFGKTIDQGLTILSSYMSEMEAAQQTVLDGEKAFALYDTYGFPLDLTRDILEEKAYDVDEAGFTACMDEQRERARAARQKTNYMGKDATAYDKIDPQIESRFVGYDSLTADGKALVLVSEITAENPGELVNELSAGQAGSVLCDVTPFYAEMGGQVGDTGVIEGDGCVFIVEDTITIPGGRTMHVGKVEAGTLRIGDSLHLSVDAPSRKATQKNHSGTHLLQKALQEVLGDHVEQKGSYVSPTRLRFDFVHFKAMTKEEIARVEEIVNAEIEKNLSVETAIMGIEEAKKAGAMALFGEKYGDEVRVVSMGDFSKELCGGTHVQQTSEIQSFKIVSESGISAGVRRIEALTGENVLRHYEEVEENLLAVSAALKSTPQEVLARIQKMKEEMRALQSEVESLKAQAAKSALGNAADEAEVIDGITFVRKKMTGVDMNGLRELGDGLKASLQDYFIFLASGEGDKANLVAMASDSAVQKGVRAGDIIKAAVVCVDGGGGGKPTMAQAGGKNPAGIDEALAVAERMLREQLS